MDKNEAENRAKLYAGIVACGALAAVLWATRSPHQSQRAVNPMPKGPSRILSAQVPTKNLGRVLRKDLIENTAALIQVFGETGFGWPIVLGDDGVKVDCFPQGKGLLRIPRGYDRPPRNPRLCFRFGNKTIMGQSLELPQGKKTMPGIPPRDSRIACELNLGDSNMPSLRFRLKAKDQNLHCQVKVLNSTWYKPAENEVFSFENPKMSNDCFAFLPNAHCAQALRADVVTYTEESQSFPFKAKAELLTEEGVTYFRVAENQTINLPGGHAFTLPRQGNRAPVCRPSRRTRLNCGRVQPTVFGPFGAVDPNMTVRLVSPTPEELGIDQIAIEGDTLKAKTPQTGPVKTGPVEIALNITIHKPKPQQHYVVDLPVEKNSVVRR